MNENVAVYLRTEPKRGKIYSEIVDLDSDDRLVIDRERSELMPDMNAEWVVERAKKLAQILKVELIDER